MGHLERTLSGGLGKAGDSSELVKSMLDILFLISEFRVQVLNLGFMGQLQCV